MSGTSRAKMTSRFNYVEFQSTSPLSRVCPTCEALIGQFCWNLKRTLYPITMKQFHQERRRPRSTAEVAARAEPQADPALFPTPQTDTVVEEKPPRPPRGKARFKWCQRCFEKLPVSEFKPRQGRKGGVVSPYCTACVVSYAEDWRTRNGSADGG